MLKTVFIFIFLLYSFIVPSQITFGELKGELEWTYTCGGKFEKIQITDSLNVTPNPFSKRTLASYSFGQNDTVSLIVYNYVGQTLITVHNNSVMPSGQYQDSILMDSFPDGIYFAHLKLGTRKNIVRKIVKSAGVGIAELTKENFLIVYPNPVESLLFIKLEQTENENLEIEIIDQSGKTIMKQPFYSQINVSELSSGWYFVKISGNGKVFYSEFIKN